MNNSVNQYVNVFPISVINCVRVYQHVVKQLLIVAVLSVELLENVALSSIDTLYVSIYIFSVSFVSPYHSAGVTYLCMSCNTIV
jgi:hypothetical protein